MDTENEEKLFDYQCNLFRIAATTVCAEWTALIAIAATALFGIVSGGTARTLMLGWLLWVAMTTMTLMAAWWRGKRMWGTRAK